MDCFLFNNLSDGQKEKILNRFGKCVSLAKGKELYRCKYLGIILSGTAQIFRKGETGETVVMRKIGAGEAFGAASVFGAWKEGSSSIVSQSECSVIYIGENELKSIVSEYPAAALNYIEYLSDKIRFLNRRIDMFSAGSTVGKVYEYIVTTADPDGFMKADFGMAELARRLKIGRTSLYRAIDSLENSGLVSRENGGFRLACNETDLLNK